jgi:hypothetical protein
MKIQTILLALPSVCHVVAVRAQSLRVLDGLGMPSLRRL